MDCSFQSLNFGNDGYVVRCRQCGQYQVAFITTVLTLSEREFRSFCAQVRETLRRCAGDMGDPGKTVVLRTPLQGVCICVLPAEANSLLGLLEEAETESKTQDLIKLFNP
jgi:hypothetical protein